MNRKSKLVISIIVALIHNYIFWDQYLGVNMLAFSLIVLIVLYAVNPEGWKSRRVWIIAISLVLTSVAVVVNGSFIARLANIVSSIFLIVTVHAPYMRSIFYIMLGSLEKVIRLPSSLSHEKSEKPDSRNNSPRLSTVFKIWVLPIITFFVFLFIYKAANPVFDQYLSNFFDQVGIYLSNFFVHISFTRILFFNFGLLLAFYLVFKPTQSFLSKYELSLNDFLIRKRPVLIKRKGEPKFLMTDLRSELKIAIALMILLNILLFVVNAIDINWLWFNFDISKAGNLSQLVHEGTYFLILSILLSMFIIGYYYRRNLNFVPNKNLKILSYLWIVQNAVMVVSVAVRNYHYIAQHGLAYKRIGVIIFLILVLIGLLSQAIKIQEIRSSFFLIKFNSWAVYVTLILMACVNWDLVIAQHNMNHKNPMQTDLKFLLTLSNKVLPVLSQNQALFKNQTTQNWRYEEINLLDKRIEDFKADYAARTFWSWNYADYNAYKQLSKTSI